MNHVVIYRTADGRMVAHGDEALVDVKELELGPPTGRIAPEVIASVLGDPSLSENARALLRKAAAHHTVAGNNE